jgi:uncharacterized protein
VVKTGDIVTVKVLEVDVARKRIALTRRLDDSPAPAKAPGERDARPAGGQRREGGGARQGGRGAPAGARPGASAAPANNALADAFARAKRGG